MARMAQIARDMLDPQVLKAVERAEAKSEYRYGPAVFIGPDDRGQHCFVHITFYPKPTWWVSIGDAEPIAIGDALLNGRIQPLKL